MHSRRTLRASTIVSTLALAACAGNGQGLDNNGRPITEGSGGGGTLTADFQSIQDHVFTPICTVCHAGANAPQGLRLDSANSYDLLVGVRSNEVSSLQRVRPGDPDHSYIIQKLEGHAAVGARMPFGGPYLDQATIDVIRQWITDGALRSPAAAAIPGFAITAMSPASGDVLAAAPPSVIIGFTHELDRTRIDGSVMRLEKLPADPGSEPQVIDASIAVGDANPSALVVTPRTPLEPGRYALQARDAAVTDLAGDVLQAGASNGAALMTFQIGAQP
jgi:methionine-rich copper-binding protein CopC